MSEISQEEMSKCPIDGNFFVPKAGKIVCSPKCKRLMDSQNRRRRNLEAKLEAEKEVATADANREAANARRRQKRAEQKAQEAAANKVQYETPEEAAEWTRKPNWPVLAFYVGLLVIVILLIANVPNGK